MSHRYAVGTITFTGIICCLCLILAACSGVPPALPFSLARPSPTAVAQAIPPSPLAPTVTRPPTTIPANSPTPLAAPATPALSATSPAFPTATTAPVGALGSAQATQPLSITMFTVSPQVINPGDIITLSWKATGGDLSLYHLDTLGRLTLPAYPVSGTGTMSFLTDAAVQNRVVFELVAVGPKSGGAAPPSVSAQVAVDVRCQPTWFFTPGPQDCPAAPAASGPAAAQPFERGLMIRLDGKAGIYILYADGQSPAWEFQSLALATGQATPAAPPAGRLPPAPGMSLVWSGGGTGLNRPGDRLGWATGPEVRFTGALQCDAAPKYNTCYLLGSDNAVLVLKPEAAAWATWATPTPLPR